MRLSYLLVPLLAFSGAVHAKGPHGGITDTSSSPHAKIRSVDLNAVHWTHGFWAERFDLSDRVMIPAMWQVLQIPSNGASYRNLGIAAGLEKGKFESTNWSDGVWAENSNRRARGLVRVE